MRLDKEKIINTQQMLKALLSIGFSKEQILSKIREKFPPSPKDPDGNFQDSIVQMVGDVHKGVLNEHSTPEDLKKYSNRLLKVYGKTDLV